MDVGWFGDVELGGGGIDVGFVGWCCSSDGCMGVCWDLVRRYSIQVKCSFKAMVCCWRKMQQGQLLTCFSIWFVLWGDEGELDWGGSKLRWARCNAKRALSSWASFSTSTNFKCSEEGDGGGAW